MLRPAPAQPTSTARVVVFLVILTLASLLVAWAIRTNTEEENTPSALPSQGKFMEPSIRPVRCSADCGELRVFDAWTNGVYIVFHYSQPVMSPPLLLSAERIDENGKATPIMIDLDWLKRFAQAKEQEDGLAMPVAPNEPAGEQTRVAGKVT